MPEKSSVRESFKDLIAKIFMSRLLSRFASTPRRDFDDYLSAPPTIATIPSFSHACRWRDDSRPALTKFDVDAAPARTAFFLKLISSSPPGPIMPHFKFTWLHYCLPLLIPATFFESTHISYYHTKEKVFLGYILIYIFTTWFLHGLLSQFATKYYIDILHATI